MNNLLQILMGVGILLVAVWWFRDATLAIKKGKVVWGITQWIIGIFLIVYYLLVTL
jgi:hypothetical protein